MQPITLKIVLNPETNDFVLESPLSGGDTVVMLERARLAVLHNLSQPRQPGVTVPAPGVARKLLAPGG